MQSNLFSSLFSSSRYALLISTFSFSLTSDISYRSFYTNSATSIAVRILSAVFFIYVFEAFFKLVIETGLKPDRHCHRHNFQSYDQAILKSM